MKAEVKLGNQPWQPGVWLNKSEIEVIITWLPADSWLCADLVKKLSEAEAIAERQNAAHAAEKSVDKLNVVLKYVPHGKSAPFENPKEE